MSRRRRGSGCVGAANVNDTSSWKETIEAVVIRAPDPEKILTPLPGQAYDDRPRRRLREHRLRPPRPPHRRGGARRPGRETSSRPALDRGAHVAWLPEVPRMPSCARREPGLLGPRSTRMRLLLVRRQQCPDHRHRFFDSCLALRRDSDKFSSDVTCPSTPDLRGFSVRLNGVEPSRPVKGTSPSSCPEPAAQSGKRPVEPNPIRLQPAESGYSGV